MPLYPKPPTCIGCEAHSVGKSFVKPTGPQDATIAIIGQGPGEQEAYNGLAFVGPSGRRLNSWLRTAGIDRHKCMVLNIIQCWVPNNRPPRGGEVDWCRERHWGPTLDSLKNLRVIIPVGVPAGKVFLGKHYKSSMAGSIVKWDETKDLE